MTKDILCLLLVIDTTIMKTSTKAEIALLVGLITFVNIESLSLRASRLAGKTRNLFERLEGKRKKK